MPKDADIGFLGGGQLARMSIQAAQRMGLSCLSLDPDKNSPASQISDSIVGALNSAQDLVKIFETCERVTLENEFVPADTLLEAISQAGRHTDALIPGLQTLGTIQDKLKQRQAYLDSGVPSPRAVPLEGDSASVIEVIGFPMVLKARFGGYDGKGTRYARNQEELDLLRDDWCRGGWLAEEFVPFKRELAVMVYATASGFGVFPTMETRQVDHICDLVFPAETDASQTAIDAVRAVRGVGLFGVELFELESGEFIVNEMAPRPHNSGHYTLDWGGVSQFEQHVRLVMGYLPEPPNGRSCAMANLIGQSANDDFRSGIAAATQISGVHVHWYGKAESRVGRKMGHINAVGDNCTEKAIEARRRFYDAVIR